MTCVEVGVGFGGQSALLNRLGGVQAFHLFDLPPVLDLTRKFTSLAGSTGDFQFHDGTKINNGPQSDIFISNYAFSELTRALQERYLDQVIARSERGYITWNPLSPDGFRPRDLVDLIPGSKILPERPLTHRDNCIIVWGSEEELAE